MRIVPMMAFVFSLTTTNGLGLLLDLTGLPLGFLEEDVISSALGS
jgi:hypothetical protein